MNKISGIYKTTNIITGDFYIGSSKDVKKRWSDHKSPSTWAKLPNSKLYQDMAQYGLNNFKFEIIEETIELKIREQFYIEQLQPTYNDRQANGLDLERRKETNRKDFKRWYKTYREYYLNRNKEYNNRLCLYEGKTLTLNALGMRFRRQGIAYPYKEAKKYLQGDIRDE